jgi:CubicO group peptidase (beta-lactamase class C family)
MARVKDRNPGRRGRGGRVRLGAVALVLAGCGPSATDLASVDYTPVVRPDWPVATPAEVGLDSAALARLYWNASRNETTRSVLVVKDGRLVAEEYFNDGGIDIPTNLQSATKSVTSALTGIAIREGCLPGVDARVMDWFPELVDSIRDPRKFDITVEHLLEMRAGFQWEEANDALFDLLYAGLRPVHLATVPLVRDPGSGMEYSNLSTHLLGIVLTRACDTDLLEFASEHLFGPLGIEPGDWWFSWEDYRLGMSSLHLTARDMARFGQLYLQDGVWEGERILPEGWVERSLATHSEDAWHIGIGDNVRDLAYGYQWWTVRSGDRQYSMAWGHGGQQIDLLPEEGMVIVVTADPLEAQHGGGPWRKEKENLNLVGDFVAGLPTR